jgi:hypothetical protein
MQEDKMSPNEVGALVLLVATGLALWMFAFVIGPAASRSRFGWKLTEIRDEVEDRFLLAGGYADDEAIRSFHTLVDGLLVHAAGFTVYNAMTVHRSFSRLGITPREQIGFEWSNHSPEVARAMKGYETELANASVRYLIFGSPFGWLISPVMMIRGLVNARRARHQADPVTLPVDDDPFADHPFTRQAVTDYETAIDIAPTMLDRRPLLIA